MRHDPLDDGLDVAPEQRDGLGIDTGQDPEPLTINHRVRSREPLPSGHQRRPQATGVPTESLPTHE